MIEKYNNYEKIKLFFYFTINFLLMIFFLYYVTAFCAVYQNTQKSWFTGGLTSFGISLAIPFGLCLFFALGRMCSIEHRIKCLFQIIKLLNYFL